VELEVEHDSARNSKKKQVLAPLGLRLWMRVSKSCTFMEVWIGCGVVSVRSRQAGMRKIAIKLPWQEMRQTVLGAWQVVLIVREKAEGVSQSGGSDLTLSCMAKSILLLIWSGL
jgi:hypothetical protein